MGKYDGKNVVITGGSSGLGLATAQLLTDEGARVMITGRTPETLQAASRQLGDTAITVRSDTSSLDDIDALADRVKAEFATVDALFVNAGIGSYDPFETVTEQTYDEVFAINTKGPYFTVQKLTPLLAEGSGVVLTTSIANVLAYDAVSVYSASKAALRSMARTLARELMPRKIRVNAVSPGPIDVGKLRGTACGAGGQAESRVRREQSDEALRLCRRIRQGRSVHGLRRDVHDRSRAGRRRRPLTAVTRSGSQTGPECASRLCRHTSPAAATAAGSKPGGTGPPATNARTRAS